MENSYHQNSIVLNSELVQDQPTDKDVHRLNVFRKITNKGKDIGGKLVLMDAYLRTDIKSDILLLIHDKRSPYHTNSSQWQQQLFNIASHNMQQKASQMFASDKKLGILAAKGTVRNELHNTERRKAYIDSDLILKLREQYNIHPPDLNYVAGTMFWVRESIYRQFFAQHSPLRIRATLEDGNVTDETPTITHAWERLLSWLVTAQGYKIETV